MVQYHALGLLYQIRSNDRLAINKLVQKFSKTGLRSPYAVCYLVRIAAKLLAEDDQYVFLYRRYPIFSEPIPQFSPLLILALDTKVKWLYMKLLAQLLDCRIPHRKNAYFFSFYISRSELAPAISVLQLFCSSPKSSLRFAAVRTLNKVSMKHPQAVMSCNVDLEKLITDPNRFASNNNNSFF